MSKSSKTHAPVEPEPTHPPSTTQRPTEARIVATERDGATRIQIADGEPDLYVGDQILVYAWPPANRSSDVANARVTANREAVIAHPFGPTGRKVWIRRVSVRVVQQSQPAVTKAQQPATKVTEDTKDNKKEPSTSRGEP